MGEPSNFCTKHCFVLTLTCAPLHGDTHILCQRCRPILLMATDSSQTAFRPIAYTLALSTCGRTYVGIECL